VFIDYRCHFFYILQAGYPNILPYIILEIKNIQRRLHVDISVSSILLLPVIGNKKYTFVVAFNDVTLIVNFLKVGHLIYKFKLGRNSAW
jgi:hypothetical protein